MYAFTVLVLLHFLFFWGEGFVCVFLLLFFCFVSYWVFCHFDIDVYIYSTCAFLIVKWILMLIMYSAASLYIFTGYSVI